VKLYEILIPPAPLEWHHEWDKKVIRLAGGLTILPPVKGRWQDTKEQMIPVRIATDLETMQKVAAFTRDYYNQQSVIFYEVSPMVEFV
jgi:hypothetical protein